MASLAELYQLLGKPDSVPSLESQMVASLQTAIVESPELKSVKFDKQTCIFGFSVIREALVKSIEKAATVTL